MSTSTSWSELSATAAERRSLGIATETKVYAAKPQEVFLPYLVMPNNRVVTYTCLAWP